MATFISDHLRIDARSLALHRLIAAKLLADPSLLDVARANVHRWQAGDAGPALALAEWEQILAGSPDEIARLITDTSETATRLRQSSPFTGILTDAERAAIYESYTARAYHPGGQPDLR